MKPEKQRSNFLMRKDVFMNAYQKQYAQSIADCAIQKIGHLTELDLVETKPGKLCLGLECLDRDLWDFDRAWPLIQKLGIRRVRIQSGWQKTEKRKGEYDFEWLDHIVDRLVGAGIDPFLCLCYGNKIYCDDSQKYPAIENGGIGHLPVTTPGEREGWINYVDSLTKHFTGRIRYYELMNEADLSIFVKVDMPWVDAYMEFVKMSAPIIRKNVANSVIISCTANVFRTELLIDSGIADYVDIHSFHAYKFFPEAFPADAMKNLLMKFRKKAPTLKFWRGESGCPSYNDPKSRGALSDVAATEPKQAKFIMRHLISDLSNDLIELSSYFHAYDFMHFSKIVRYHYGLIRHEDLSTKPSYDVFQVLTHIFDGTIRANEDSKLSYLLQKIDHMPTNEEYASLKFYSFQKEDARIYAYFLPKYIEDEVVVKTIHLSLPADMDPDAYIILDPLTRQLYALTEAANAYLCPVTDYPLLIVEKKMIEGFAVIGDGKAKTEADDELLTQGDHE